MQTRFASTLALIIVLLAASVASANSAKKPTVPRKASPKLTLTPVAVSGSYVKPTIAVTFKPPTGRSLSQSCKGKLKISAPIGKKKVKRRGKTRRIMRFANRRAALKAIGENCVASGPVKLPATMVGKRVKFTASFKGNSAVKRFKKSTRLTVSLPAPPPAPRIDPAKGNWIAQGKDGKGLTVQWSFAIEPDGTVKAIDRLGPVNVFCPSHTAGFIFGVERSPFNEPFSATYVDTTGSDTDLEGGQNLTQTFKIHFDSPSHATGTFQITGLIEGPLPIAETETLHPGCDTGQIAIELMPGIFT